MPNDESNPEPLEPSRDSEPEVSLTTRQNANFALLLILGALTGIWLYAYTEWIPTLKEWISGGNGLFLASGLAVLVLGGVSKLGRKRLLLLLDKRLFFAVPVLLFFVLAWVAASHGSIRLELTTEFREDFVEVFDSSRHSLAHRIPPAEGEFREVVPASLQNSSLVWIAVKNRPYEPVALAGLWRRPLVSVPSHLTREVVLLHGDDPFLRFTANGPGADLTIDVQRRDGRVLHAVRAAYKGQALWLGCRTSVELPSIVKATLQQEMKNPEEGLLRPACPFESDDVCEFSWDGVASATVEWKLGSRGRKSPIEFERLSKIDFVRRRAIEF